MKITSIILSTLASCVIYISVFAFAIHKPLTVGIQKEYYQKKIDYLSCIEGRKLVITAGSNGRFSHRCETIEQEVGFPCANMSIAANISLDYQFEILKPYLKRGDAVYLPLEYGVFEGGKKELMGGLELPYIMAYNHAYLRKMNFERVLHAFFYFDLKFVFSGIGEMLLKTLGVERRYSVDTLTPQGDESGHTREKGVDYRELIRTMPWTPPNPDAFDPLAKQIEFIGNFLTWAGKNGVLVIGGMPTTFDDAPVPEAIIAARREYFVQHGQAFFSLENRSQYPRSEFYDTPYHLNEESQIGHSKKIAPLLINIIKQFEKMATTLCPRKYMYN